MKFTGGARCWNGPDRSLTLKFECGATDALLSIDEPEKCAYAGRFATPAACDGRAARELRLELEEATEGEGAAAAAGARKDEL
jgi:protein kinase C substrate 80K-H